MLTEDPTETLTKIREGVHPLSIEPCVGQPMADVSGLFQRAAAERGTIASDIFQSDIRALACNLRSKNKLPATLAEYVKLVDDKVFSNLPKG